MVWKGNRVDIQHESNTLSNEVSHRSFLFVLGDEEDKKETEGSNGPVGKDAVEDNNANIVVTEDEKEDETNNEDNDENNDESKDSTDDSADIIPLQMEAEEEEDESLLPFPQFK